jgi:DinB superfamily
MQSLAVLRKLLIEVPGHLRSLPADAVERKPSPSKWSPKEELGHLLDSAANNHQRIVRTQLENKPAMPDYDGDRWVELHRYQQRQWPELVELWRYLNQQLLVAAEAVPDSAWLRTCTIANSGPLTLQFVFDDYIKHMRDHLRHIGVSTG